MPGPVRMHLQLVPQLAAPLRGGVRVPGPQRRGSPAKGPDPPRSRRLLRDPGQSRPEPDRHRPRPPGRGPRQRRAGPTGPDPHRGGQHLRHPLRTTPADPGRPRGGREPDQEHRWIRNRAGRRGGRTCRDRERAPGLPEGLRRRSFDQERLVLPGLRASHAAGPLPPAAADRHEGGSLPGGRPPNRKSPLSRAGVLPPEGAGPPTDGRL
jgi:hypothetical protein